MNAVVLLLFMLTVQSSPQKRQEAVPTFDVKRCTPKLFHKKPFPKPKTLQPRKGEKATGYSPLIAFEILESGEVVNVHLKRRSGIHVQDGYALDEIRASKFNSRPGCGTLEMQSDMLIHFY
jgi:hypothetical protein